MSFTKLHDAGTVTLLGSAYLECAYETHRHTTSSTTNYPEKCTEDDIPEKGSIGTELNIVQEGIPSLPTEAAISAGKNR